jgi:hypothetical protein
VDFPETLHAAKGALPFFDTLPTLSVLALWVVRQSESTMQPTIEEIDAAIAEEAEAMKQFELRLSANGSGML